MGGWGPALPGGVCPPLPQGSDPGGWRPCLGLRLPSRVRVLSCCACRLWSGEHGVALGRRWPGVRRESAGCLSRTGRCAILGSQGSQEAAPSGIMILTIAIITHIS